jgi:SAM-dependent methyltransferase
MTDPTSRVEQFFSGLMIECWRNAMPEEATKQEADFLEKQLQLAAGARVLDVPCGTGRHSCELAGRGHQLTGVDLSSTCLEEARALAAKKHVQVDWQHKDMADLPWTETFDAAFSMGNSFGYLDDDHDARFLKNVARALRPGSRFVLDYPAVAEALLPNYQERWWMPVGEMYMFRDGRYNPLNGRIEMEYSVLKDGKLEKKPWSQRVYTYQELSRLFLSAGFTDVAGYGSLTLEPFKLRSQRLLLIAKKGKA